MRERAEQRAADALLSGAAQADEADDLGLRDREIDRAGACDRQAATRRAASSRERGRRRGLELSSALPTISETSSSGVVSATSRSPTSAPSRSTAIAVGDLEHLVEPMRDIDHADAARLQRPQRVEQAVDLVGGKRGRRFVEHEDVGLAR